MKQFNLEEWLQDKSRKVMTRDGRSVRIICTDANEETPIAALVTVKDIGLYKLATALYTKDGRYGVGNSPYDLFFADEEDELTELQKTLEEDCDYYAKLYNDGYTREELREWIKCWCNSIIDLARKELEKENPYSGNQKQEWSEEDECQLQNAIDALEFLGKRKEYRSQSGYDAALSAANWLKSLKDRVQPQPKQEWSEEDEQNLQFWLDNNKSIDSDKRNWLKSLKDRVQTQTKQEWNKKDENFLESIINDTEQGALLDKEQINWLKSLRDKTQLQMQQEWSEEDEKNWRHCLHYIDAYVTPVKEHVDWYKNIRNRIGWKPSEEQMDELEDVINFLKSNNILEKEMETLYNDLKKL